MDSVTQFLMGSAMGQVILGPKHKGKGALIGGIAGSLPDLDALPLMKSSVINQLVHHRGISHSILFCCVTPLCLAWLCTRFIRWNISFVRWYMFWLMAFLTHILLDVMTTWGTQIFWPNTVKISLDALFIIDPLITLPLLIGCGWSAWKRCIKPSWGGIIVVAVYMIFAISAHTVMTHKFSEAFVHNAIKIDSQIVRPTPFNTLFWAVSARTPTDELLFGYARLWDTPDSITFSKPLPQDKQKLNIIANRKDLQQLLSITKGFYVVESTSNQLIIKDARFGQFGGWTELTSDTFIFQYCFDIHQKEWSLYRPPIKHTKDLFYSLFQAIFH